MAEDSLLRVPKRPKIQTDVKIVVGDGEVSVHSVILILASPVFEKMLSSCMHEGSATEITLPGKKRSEFVTFYKALQLYSMEPLTEDSAVFLSCWADEYQIEALKTKCEEYLVSSVPVDSSSLKHAMTYGMHKRVTQCVDTMKKRRCKVLGRVGRPDRGEHERVHAGGVASSLRTGEHSAFPDARSRSGTCNVALPGGRRPLVEVRGLCGRSRQTLQGCESLGTSTANNPLWT